MQKWAIMECHDLTRTLRRSNQHKDSQACFYIHFLHLGEGGRADGMKYLVNGKNGREWDYLESVPQCMA